MGQMSAEYQEFNSYSSTHVERKYYSNFYIYAHFHANPEIIYVSEGELDIAIDGVQNHICANQYCIVLPWQIHSCSTREMSESMILVFPDKYISYFSQNMSSSHGETQVFPAEPLVHQMFLQYLYNDAEVNEYLLSSILYGLCHSFVSNCKIVPNADRKRNLMLVKMMDYVSAHFKEDLSLKDVATALGYNYYYLSHLFCEYSGLTFQQFRNMKRIDYARNELVRTQKPVTDIAFECGFSCVRTFNRVFRDLVQMTPVQYRAQNSKIIDGKRILAHNNYYDYGNIRNEDIRFTLAAEE